jgi:hypothetical protein
MAISRIRITNLTTGDFALDVKIDEDRQLREKVAYGSYVDVQGKVTIEELNRNTEFQALVNPTDGSSAKLSVAVDPQTPDTDFAGVPTVAKIQRRTGFPQISFITGQTVGIAAIPQNKTITGVNFLQGRSRASIVFGTGTSSVTVTANRPGTPGNLISVALVDGAATSVAVSGGAVTGQSNVSRTVTVTYRGPGNGNVDNANAVAALINADAVATRLVRAVGGGTGNVTAAAATALNGGTGAGFQAFIGGIELNVNNAITETSLPAQTVALTGMANLDMAALYVISDNIQSMPFNVQVVT